MTQRSIFISGGAGGIGLTTAKHFAAKGWRVGIGDFDAKALERARSEVEVETFRHNVCEPAEWARVLETFSAPQGGALDVLINNAGVLTFGWLDEQDPATFGRVVDVNVKGVLYGAHAGVKHLSKARGSCLVNMGSSASLQAPPILALYAATKFAVRGLSEALDIAYMRHGVRVACVEPYCVDTPMLDADAPDGLNYRAAVQNGEILSTSDIAQAIWTAVHGDQLHYPVGTLSKELVAELSNRHAQDRAYWGQIFAAQAATENPG